MKHLVQHAARLALAMAACGLMFASSSRAQLNCCQTPGDANGDDSVNLADITFLIARIFSGGPPPPCHSEADANGSGKVNISDVTFLISRIFASGPAPECAVTDPSGLIFSVYESGSLNGNPGASSMILRMSIRTKKVFPCFNYEMPTDISIAGNSIVVSLGEPQLPGGEFCLDAIGPATSNVTLPQIEGGRSLNFIWNDILDQYLLLVSNELISLTTLNASETVPLHENLWRYPENSLEVHCSSSDSSEPCERLYLSLQQIQGLEEITFGSEATTPFYRGDKFYVYETGVTVQILDSVISNFRLQELQPGTGTVGFTIWLEDQNRNMYWPR